MCTYINDPSYFVPTTDVDPVGMSLCEDLPGVSMGDIVKTFPDGVCEEGYYEPERGYDNSLEVRFVTSDGKYKFNVYSRWGTPRIACYSNDNAARTAVPALVMHIHQTIGMPNPRR